MPGDLRFKRENRILRRREYGAVRETRRRVGDDILQIAWRKLDAGPARLGMIVPIRGLGAVARNRIKRVLREVFRSRLPSLPAGLEIVVTPRDRAAAQNSAAAAASFDDLVARLLKRERG